MTLNQAGLWFLHHIGIIVRDGILPPVYGSFGPEGQGKLEIRSQKVGI